MTVLLFIQPGARLAQDGVLGPERADLPRGEKTEPCCGRRRGLGLLGVLALVPCAPSSDGRGKGLLLCPLPEGHHHPGLGVYPCSDSNLQKQKCLLRKQSR